MGLARYFTGRPCIRDHVAERQTVNATCLECVRERRTARWAANRLDMRAAKRAWHAKNSERLRPKIREASRAYRAKHTEKANEANRQWRKRNIESCRAAGRKANYKMRGLPEPTRPMPATCECCGKTSRNRALHLDHCHETGKFRGWLCVKCNTGVGSLGDNVSGLQTAISYLKRGDS